MACDPRERALASKYEYETDSAIFSDCSEYDEPDCPDLLDMSFRCHMHEGIKLEMWTQSPKMKTAVNLIIALRRMKHIQLKSSEFGEDEVLSIIMDDIIEERHMNAVDFAPSYTKSNQTLLCSICDQFKKSLVRSNGSPHLMAVTLNDKNSQYKVRFSLSMYVTPRPGPTSSQPVCLGISKSNLYLACAKSDDSNPQLVVKEITGSLNTIKTNDPNGYDNLLFFRKETGAAINTFESVKYPGWFISTDFEDHEEVKMTQVPSTQSTNFTLEDQQKV